MSNEGPIFNPYKLIDQSHSLLNVYLLQQTGQYLL